MSDLNDWVLTTDDAVLAFGTASTDYPFATQVEISEIEREVQDENHPTSDGTLMGRDLLRGFTLQFTCKILQEYPLTAKPWMSALDLYDLFAGRWRADRIRLSPGEYATMENTERGRLVYGRPRGIAPKHGLLRRGLVDFQMDFDTNGPNFYSNIEKTSVINRDPSSSGGLTSPLTAPLSTTITGESIGPTINDGTLPAWPVLDFHGPSINTSLELFDGVVSLWKIRVAGQIKHDEVLTVDTRPWRRSATINGRPANGMIRGAQLEKCTIPVGTFSARYRSGDRTGTAFVAITWRDTFASL